MLERENRLGGVEAAGGFAYQHAQAVQVALRLAQDAALHRLRVEATNDVIDAEVWSNANDLVEGLQYKRRNESDTWGQQELIDELVEWSSIARCHPTALYKFLTDGRLGPTGRKVRDALQQATNGNNEPISALLSEKAKSPYMLEAMRRASISSDPSGYQSLIERAEVVAKGLLLNVTSEAEAKERGRWVVLELLNLVTERSGLHDPDDRFIYREEVIGLLATPQDRIPTTSWDADLRQLFHASVLSRVASDLLETSCEPDPIAASQSARSMESGLLEQWITPGATCLLGGPSGSGKSTMLHAMQRRAAAEGRTVIVCSAESYIAGRLPALVAAGLNHHSFIGAHPAVGTAVLGDPSVVLAIDGLSEIPSDTRREFAKELKSFLGANPRADLVLSGRETTTLRTALQRGASVVDLVVRPLSESDQQALVKQFYKCGDDIASDLVREANYKLSGVVKNPLMLVLGVRAILLNQDAANPAEIFQAVVRSIADDNGYATSSVYEVALGLAYSQLLDQERRYCDTVAWGRILNEVARHLTEYGYDVSARDIREFGFETGLVRTAQLDSVRPIHDSYADYFAAAAVHSSLAALPAALGVHDRARASYLAQLSGVEPRIADLLTRDLPLAAVAATLYEKRRPQEVWLEQTQRLVNHLLPESVRRPGIAHWADSSGRRIVTIDGLHEGWWDGSLPDGQAPTTGWTFPLTPGQGPLFVAVQVWRRHLDGMLTPPAALDTKVPRTLAESIALLTRHSAELHDCFAHLLGTMNLPATEAKALTEHAKNRLQFLLRDGDVDGDERERSVRFRETEELHAESIVIVGNDEGEITWTGWGRVDSFVRTGPVESAMRAVRTIINQIVGRIWL